MKPFPSSATPFTSSSLHTPRSSFTCTLHQTPRTPPWLLQPAGTTFFLGSLLSASPLQMFTFLFILQVSLEGSPLQKVGPGLQHRATECCYSWHTITTSPHIYLHKPVFRQQHKRLGGHQTYHLIALVVLFIAGLQMSST